MRPRCHSQIGPEGLFSCVSCRATHPLPLMPFTHRGRFSFFCLKCLSWIQMILSAGAEPQTFKEQFRQLPN